MKIISVEVLRAALGEMDYEDVNTLLDTALDLITEPLGSFIGTEFDQALTKDVFNVHYNISTRSSDNVVLKLSRGFLTGTVAVYHNVNRDDLAGTDEVTDLAYAIDMERGLIIIKDVCPAGWFRVEYTGGFTVAVDTDYYVASEVPIWLESAAKTYASVIYQRLVTEKNRDKARASSTSASLTQMPVDLPALLAKHIRWRPTAFSPQYQA